MLVLFDCKTSLISTRYWFISSLEKQVFFYRKHKSRMQFVIGLSFNLIQWGRLERWSINNQHSTYMYKWFLVSTVNIILFDNGMTPVGIRSRSNRFWFWLSAGSNRSSRFDFGYRLVRFYSKQYDDKERWAMATSYQSYL